MFFECVCVLAWVGGWVGVCERCVLLCARVDDATVVVLWEAVAHLSRGWEGRRASCPRGLTRIAIRTLCVMSQATDQKRL